MSNNRKKKKHKEFHMIGRTRKIRAEDVLIIGPWERIVCAAKKTAHCAGCYGPFDLDRMVHDGCSTVGLFRF